MPGLVRKAICSLLLKTGLIKNVIKYPYGSQLASDSASPFGNFLAHLLGQD